MESYGANTPAFSKREKLYTYFPLYLLLRDKADVSWEDFNADALPSYFEEGIKMLKANVDKLADFSQLHTVEDDKNLWFMVESLIQARHLLEDVQKEV